VRGLKFEETPDYDYCRSLMNKGSNFYLIIVLTKIGETDDGVFDWMTILDQKRKLKEAQREAEKAAREQDGTNAGTVTGMTNVEHQVASTPSSPAVRQSIVSPANTAQAVFGDAKRISTTQKPIKDEQATPLSAAKSPQPSSQPAASPPAPAPKKRLGWFFSCCGSSRE
jgi:hypothetical protein